MSAQPVPDLLAGARWWCRATPPGEVVSPKESGAAEGSWLAAPVPGTVAEAVRRSGNAVPAAAGLDWCDWWYRCEFVASASSPHLLVLRGLATVADVWLNGTEVLHSENMFLHHNVEVRPQQGENELAIRFAALGPLLAERRPRPRWKSPAVTSQGLRWFRTSLIGRQPGYVEVPAAVGPWRAITLGPPPAVEVTRRHVVARCDGDDGVVDVELDLLWRGPPPDAAELVVGSTGTHAGLTVTDRADDGWRILVRGSSRVIGAERWWPHTHGTQARYVASCQVGAERVELGQVGFRTVELDRGDGSFRLVVNGVPLFCRGACWWPLDPVSLDSSTAELRSTLELVRAAGMNMLRIPGGTVYEDGPFWDLCDELGILVWQDCMLGYTDPPDDDAFRAGVVSEVRQVLGDLGGRPSAAVVCGGQEIEEQAAFMGLSRQQWHFPLVEDELPVLVHELLPGVPYVTSSPTGGALPFEAEAGDCHYWGVGSLLRPVEDARRCGIRFMSEGLGLGTPPDRRTVEETFGGAAAAGHDAAWKRAVHHDTARSWDLDDIRDFYTAQVFRVDPHVLRYLDAERALDLGRATNAELFQQVLAEWRRPGSSCDGALLVALRDFVPGPGWGVVDARGRPKATWFAARRVFAPVAVVVTDEGLNGLHVHVTNDRAQALDGRLHVELWSSAGRSEGVVVPLTVPSRAGVTLATSALFDGFRDIGYAYRYGPVGFDAVVAALVDADDVVLSEAVHLPMGQDRPLEPDVGLDARVRPAEAGTWVLTLTCTRLAQWVEVDTPGFLPGDSWFHLPAGRRREILLVPAGGNGVETPGGNGVETPGGNGVETPTGWVRALNSRASCPVLLEE